MNDDEAPALRLGLGADEFLNITPRARERPESRDVYDGNWIHCDIAGRSNNFHGQIAAQILAQDFRHLLEGMQRLYSDLKGSFEFAPMEKWVEIRFCGDGRGHFEAECLMRDDLADGARLTFTLSFDQTYLREWIRQIEGVCAAYPVVGVR